MPDSALADFGARAFGIYVHIPFCTVRCGYCDFNTYTALELGDQPGSSRATYAEAAIGELHQARGVIGRHASSVSTVFFGGGTPTLLPPDDLTGIVTAIDKEFGLEADAEVTTEANPDSVTRDDLARLRAGGINRISFGVQSTDPSVLGVLDRTHDPARVPLVVGWAREVGFDQVSVDLIYGTPGESLASWQRTVAEAIALGPDHVSAYALIVEEGTALARRIARGELPMPDDDDLADKYEVVDAALSAAGLPWYEVSNWSRDESQRCRHNIGYWQGADWWGIGPGAHSHIGGVRWWNVKHPAAYAARVAQQASPAAARETLDAETRRVERVLLEMRLADGLAVDVLDAGGLARVPELISDGLVEPIHPGRIVLTQRGRLLADAVVRTLLP